MRAPYGPVIIALAVAALAGCTQAPPRPADAVDARGGVAYPALVPAHQITGRVPPPSVDAQSVSTQDQRAARLRARAARLGTPVIDEATRDRMRAGVTR